MNSPFKFLRRVRIHGRECGAVARALHHEVKGLSLYQADLEKSSGSTNERKQMSTKTTLKRIALVAVSALGFGLLASGPSRAANTTTTAFTKSQALSTSYLTVVQGTATPRGIETGTASGLFYVDVTNESVAANAGTVVGLAVNSETMTLLATSAPTGSSINHIAIRPVKVESAIGATNTAANTNAVRAIPATGDTWTASTFVLSGARITANESSDFNPTTANPTGASKRYWFAVATADTATVVNSGYFNIRVRTQTADNRVLDSNIQVRFVPTIADAGATITVAGTGSLFTGETLTYQSNRYYTATLAGPNSDRIQLGADVSITGLESGTVASLAPSLTASLTSSAGVEIAASNLEATDDGDSGQDYVFTSTTAVTGSTLDLDEKYADIRNLSNGVYGITNNGTGNGLPSLTELATNLLRVRLTGASTQGTLAVSTGPARTALASVQTKITATGVAAADAAFTTTTAANPSATKAYSLPLSVKSVTLTIDSAVASQNITTTTTWSGNYASANVTPATTTALTTATNADGEITRVITNSSPLAGAVATVVISGFNNPDNTVTVTLTWAAAVATTVTVLEPVAGIHTKLKGTTNFTVEVKDQFGAKMAGELLQPLVGGSATSGGNYSATTTYATITTGADGTATWSLTDATGIADGTDSITFRSISNSSAVSSAYTITYKTTVAAVSSFLSYYNNDMGATANTTVPTGGIYADTTGARLSLMYGVNLSDGTLDDTVDTTADALVQYRFRALTSAGVPATGASVTVTAGTGGHVLSSTGLPLSSRTFAVGTTGDITFIGFATAPGAIKFTVTSGTVSSEAAMWIAAPTGTAARTIAISGAATGTANGDGVPMSVTVKDRYGNLVGSVLITTSASGVGNFTGGGTTQSYTTDATGTYTFLATSLVSAGGSGTFSASIATAGTDATSAAGYYGSTEVDSTVAAGVATASQAVVFAAGQNKAEAAAEAATDAAAEAIDAANAATDAANLAAEAADAATVAAEEARDAADAATAAVEELATQVATLMAALKAQITTLANTVAKIAKKVKA
jgi:hypothetical protein